MVEYEMTAENALDAGARARTADLRHFDTAGGERIFIGVVTKGMVELLPRVGLQELPTIDSEQPTDRIRRAGESFARYRGDQGLEITDLSARRDALKTPTRDQPPEDLRRTARAAPRRWCRISTQTAYPFRVPALRGVERRQYRRRAEGAGAGADTEAVRAELDKQNVFQNSAAEVP